MRYSAIASSSFPWSRRAYAEVVVGLGVVGLEPDRLAVFGDRLVQLPLFSQGNAEVVVGLGVIGLEAQRVAEHQDRLARIPAVNECTAQLEVGVESVGTLSDLRAKERDGSVEDLLCLPSPTTIQEHFPQARAVPRVFGGQPCEILKDRDGLGRLSLLFQGVAELMSHHGADRPGREEESDRLLTTTRPLQAEGQIVVDPEITGIPSHGLAEGWLPLLPDLQYPARGPPAGSG